MSIEGKVVAVAGAGGGLGPTVSRTLADQGATLALAERHPELAEKCASELGTPCDSYAVDLLDAAAAKGWADHVAERFGGIDALVHLVGGWRGGKPIVEAPVEDDEFLHALLVGTVQSATRAFLPHLAQRAGRFVIVSAAQAQQPTSTNAAYASAKAAAEAWTLATADELAQHGGTANIVVVNAIVTPQMRVANPDKEYRTFTDAAEIAETIAYLLGPAASKMNGQRVSLHA
jgi:NAD(P)-dependent dehydrogenase (short-subunit alcohol dehydrogenase family)